jgi:hypothetical protein
MFTNVNHEDLWWLSLKKKDLLELAFTLSQKALPLWNGFNFPGNFKDKIKSLPQFALAEIAVSMVKKSDNESHLNDYYTSFITPVVQIQDGDLKFPYEVKLAFLSVFDILKGMLSTRNKYAAIEAFSSSITRSLDAIKISNILTTNEVAKLTDEFVFLSMKSKHARI